MTLFGARRQAAELPSEGRLPGFEGASGWLNSEPLTNDDLRGKVVLVDFWTYTCINWLRTLAWVRAWADRYADGLVVIGVHTPEFPFERDEANVRRAVEAMDVRYPVALDPDFEVWQAFANNYWPAAYLADGEGQIRYHHYGEGAYEETEQAIQQLLDADGGLVEVEPEGFEVQADWSTLQTPETYLGAQRQAENYVRDGELELNQWTLGGDWSIEPRASVLTSGEGRIALRFHARDAHLVMGPRARGDSVPFQVLLDGEPPGDAHGLDVDADGKGTLSEQRLHQLIRQHESIRDRTLEVIFPEGDAEAYCFTFG